MEKLNRQVLRARQRLNTEIFLEKLPWCWCAAILVAAVAIALQKAYPTRLDPWIWNTIWFGGALVVGLLAAFAWTYFARLSPLSAAIEIDRRFGLKERVSSCLTLGPEDRESEAGQALIQDAVARVDRLDVNDRFRVSPRRNLWLPLVPILLAGGIVLFVSERTTDAKTGTTVAEQNKKQVKKSSQALRKKILERRKRATEKGLKEAEAILKEVDEGLRDLEKKGAKDPKNGLIKLNNLADKLAERRKALGGNDKLRERLKKLKDMKKGPADKVADSIKQGKFDKALEALDQLKKKLAAGDLDDQQKRDLAEQLAQMKDKLQQMADAYEQAKQDLKQQLDKAKQAGDAAAQDQIQQQLDNLQRQQSQMNRMRNMASKLGKASDALQQGKDGEAQQALDSLSGDLEQLQQELDELETLDEAMQEIRAAKNSMNCKKCAGGDCEACQGGRGEKIARGGGEKNKGGDGLGKGRGQGDRPEQENDVKLYDSNVKQKVGPGRAVVTGKASGPNAKGRLRDAIKKEFESQASGPADPLTNQRLPKSQRGHVEEYFKSLRDGS